MGRHCSLDNSHLLRTWPIHVGKLCTRVRTSNTDPQSGENTWTDGIRKVRPRLHTAINRTDFVSWWMWFNGWPNESTASWFSRECILLPSYVYNMLQDTKSARLIAVCKRSLRLELDVQSKRFSNLLLRVLPPPPLPCPSQREWGWEAWWGSGHKTLSTRLEI